MAAPLPKGPLWGHVVDLVTPAAGGDGNVVRVLSVPEVPASHHLAVQLLEPESYAAPIRLAAQVSIKARSHRGQWQTDRILGTIAGADGVSSVLTGIGGGTQRGGFLFPGGAGLEVTARTMMMPAAIVQPVARILAQVLPGPISDKSVGPVSVSGHGGIPVNPGPGAGPWVDFGGLPFDLTRCQIVTDASTQVQLIRPDGVAIPLNLPGSGYLDLNPYPSGLFIQARVPGVTVDPTPFLVSWS